MSTRLSEPERLPCASINIAAQPARQRSYSFAPAGGEGRDEGAPRAQRKQSRNEQMPGRGSANMSPSNPACRAVAQQRRVQVSPSQSNHAYWGGDSLSPQRSPLPPTTCTATSNPPRPHNLQPGTRNLQPKTAQNQPICNICKQGRVCYYWHYKYKLCRLTI